MAVILVSPAAVTVTTSGTEQPLVAANVSGVVAIYLSAPAANTGTMYVGDSTVSTTVGIPIIKGTTERIFAPEGQILDIKNMYVDAATDGDKLNVAYLKKVN